MRTLIAAWEWLFLNRARLGLGTILLLAFGSLWFASEFRFEASADSLLLENDVIVALLDVRIYFILPSI